MHSLFFFLFETTDQKTDMEICELATINKISIIVAMMKKIKIVGCDTVVFVT